MQACRLAVTTRLENSDNLASRDWLPGGNQRTNWLIGRAEAPGMVDADHPGPGDRPGERHHAAGRRAH